MAIKADRSALPKAAPKKANPPDAQPRFLPLLAEAVMAARDDNKPTAGGTRLRHSDAAKCARALSLGLAGFPKQPVDAAGRYVMALGEHVHERFQQALVDHYGPMVEVEAKCSVPGLDASGHIDAVIYDDESDREHGHKTCYELKTTGGFGYKLAVGERGAAEGPRHSALVQGALNALASGADELVIGVVATEAISKGAAERKGIDELRRFVAEWTYPRSVWEPIAEAEVSRMQRILDLYDDGQLAPCAIPDPEVPDEARIVDPKSGRWEAYIDGDVVDTGSTWMCGYCAFQPVCAAINEPGTVSIDEARKRVEAVSDHAA